MTDINKVMLIGRLTKDIDTNDFANVGTTGMARLNFSIAVNRSRKQGEEWIDEVSYFDITAWSKLAERVAQSAQKGTQVCVEGFLKQDRWEKDGKKNSRITIVADNIQILSGRKENPQQNAYQNNGFNQPQQFAQQMPQQNFQQAPQQYQQMPQGVTQGFPPQPQVQPQQVQMNYGQQAYVPPAGDFNGDNFPSNIPF